MIEKQLINPITKNEFAKFDSIEKRVIVTKYDKNGNVKSNSVYSSYYALDNDGNVTIISPDVGDKVYSSPAYKADDVLEEINYFIEGKANTDRILRGCRNLYVVEIFANTSPIKMKTRSTKASARKHARVNHGIAQLKNAYKKML